MIKHIFLTGSVLYLSGCTVGPDYKTPSQNFSDQWYSESKGITTSKPINTQWWKNFDDPLLNKYIARAAENNKDLKIALANVRSARALRREQSGSFWPAIGATTNAGRSKSIGTSTISTVSNTYDAGFDASWEIDIFGGNRRSYEAANARLGLSQAEYQDVMLSTLSEVARTYYEARGLQKRISITNKNTQLLKATFTVIQDRLNIGETSDFDLTRAQSEYELTRARIPNLSAELKTSIYSLSVF